MGTSPTPEELYGQRPRLPQVDPDEGKRFACLHDNKGRGPLHVQDTYIGPGRLAFPAEKGAKCRVRLETAVRYVLMARAMHPKLNKETQPIKAKQLIWAVTKEIPAHLRVRPEDIGRATVIDKKTGEVKERELTVRDIQHVIKHLNAYHRDMVILASHEKGYWLAHTLSEAELVARSKIQKAFSAIHSALDEYATAEAIIFGDQRYFEQRRDKNGKLLVDRGAVDDDDHLQRMVAKAIAMQEAAHHKGGEQLINIVREELS